MFEKFLTDKQVEKKYVGAGGTFGSAVSFIYMGECIRFADMLTKWEKWEDEYAKRGYRTLPVDDFVGYGGYGKPLRNLGARRATGERPVSHARIYRKRYLGKIQPAVNLAELTNPSVSRSQLGTYVIPSTKKN